MAISKLILNGVTQMDVTSDTVSAGKLLSGETATKNDGTKVTGNIATKSAADLTVSGSTVTAAAGYYSSSVSKNVEAGTATTPAKTIATNPTITLTDAVGVVAATYHGSSSITPTVSAGYVTAGTAGTVFTTGTSTYQLTSQESQVFYPSTADQTIASYRWLTGTQTFKSVTTSNLTAANIASGVTVKVGDAYKANRIMQITGTYAPAVSSATVTPTESTQTLNATDVYGYKPVTINAISSTYVGTGVTTQAAQTFYPSTTDQTVASYRWLTGTQTFKSVTTSNLTAANIASGVIVKVGDANNASRITQVTGTYAPAVSSITVTPTETTQTFNATGVYGYKPVTVNGISSTYVGTGVPRGNNTSLYFISSTGRIITPSGYYQIDAGLTLPIGNAHTITPGSTNQYITSYEWLTGSITVKGDANLVPSNIASGVSIFGINGTHEGGGPEWYSLFATDLRTSVKFSDNSKYSILSSVIIGSIPQYYFAGMKLQGDWDFPYITEIAEFAFCECFNAYRIANVNFSSCIVVRREAFCGCNNLSTVSFPVCTTILPYAFSSCGLTIADFPVCSILSNSVFQNCKSLTTANFPICEKIGDGAFSGCSRLTTISFPSCTSIGFYAFQSCSSLSIASFSVCTYIGGSAFCQCSSLSTISFPVCEYIKDRGAFQSCILLTIASFPSCISIGSYAFNSCTSLTTANFPACTNIGNYAFYYCKALTTISFPSCINIGLYAFYGCSSLTTASFPSCISIASYAFYNCSCLMSLYFIGVSSVPVLGWSNAFGNTPMLYSSYTGNYGSIYVPSSLYNSFITASQWSTFSSRFVSV